jgi:hypothetical protein
MNREDFIFCIGFEGATAIVDGRLQRRYRSYSTRHLAEAGLFKPALCSAIFDGKPEELEEVLSLYNQRTESPVRTVGELQRIFGTFGVPAGVKKVTVV